jgi:hypothetical protein
MLSESGPTVWHRPGHVTVGVPLPGRRVRQSESACQAGLNPSQPAELVSHCRRSEAAGAAARRAGTARLPLSATVRQPPGDWPVRRRALAAGAGRPKLMTSGPGPGSE